MASPSNDWWNGRVFCLIGPDCLRRALLEPVLDMLRGAGLALTAWLPAEIGPAQVDAVSAAQGAGAGGVYRYRAMDALFGLGPAVLLILEDQEMRDAQSLYRLAQELKGHSDPYRARPGTIRRELRAVNVVMSLLHISDSPQHSAAEFSLLSRDVEAVSYLPASELPGFLAAGAQPAETRLFPQVLAGVRGRLLAGLWDALTPAGRRLAGELAASGALSEAKAGQLLAQEVTGASQRDALTEVLRMPFDASEPAPDFDRVVRILQDHRMGLDPWERTVLITSSYFSPLR